MEWVQNYQLFLFDFDGVLVDTENLHFKAYKKMCADRGFSLNWDLRTYARNALFSSTKLKDAIYKELPDLQREEPNWEILYKEKKEAYNAILKTEKVSLMPGVEELLNHLNKNQIKHCVVTHTGKAQVTLIRKSLSLLNSIPFWITREDYMHPKPNSECYELAIRRYSKPGDKIIGFEDSPKGLSALSKSGAEAIFLTSLFNTSEVEDLAQKMELPFTHYDSFTKYFQDKKRQQEKALSQEP